MNPITVFLTIAASPWAWPWAPRGIFYAGIPVVIAAIIIASALKMANIGKSLSSFARENCSRQRAGALPYHSGDRPRGGCHR